MSHDDTYPKLIFREPFGGRTAYEVPQKGWYNGLTVELEGGSQYEVFFYDPVRLSQTLESEVRQGNSFLAEPGMIVVPKVDEASMREAIVALFKQGWFDHLRPTNS